MTMTKGERDQLLSLVKKREKVMKVKAAERSATLLAEFDVQSAKIHHWDEDKVWAEVKAEAEKAIGDAQIKIAARCRELGIPVEFAPGLQMYWHGRGHNEVASRRQELRRAAKSKIEAIEKEAVSKIEALSLDAQTNIIAHGLESEAAKQFLDQMPALDKLMPPVQVTEIQALVDARRAKSEQGMLEYKSYL
jgi:azurin